MEKKIAATIRMRSASLQADTELRTKYKRQAAERAVEFVQPGMLVGLGTGSTAIFATRRIAHLFQDDYLKDILGFATSEAVWEEAQRLGIPMMTEEMPHSIDLTIDGADEIDPNLNLIKGGGGALLREKIVAQASRRVIIVADDSKLSAGLGTLHTLPIEVLPFGWRSQFRYLESLGAQVEVRFNTDGSPFITDSGGMILDCNFGPIAHPAELAATMKTRAGIAEHGLFLGLTTDVIVAGREGLRHLTHRE
jgi:ribose 5-phosphate isomerase A